MKIETRHQFEPSIESAFLDEPSIESAFLDGPAMVATLDSEYVQFLDDFATAVVPLTPSVH